MGVYVMNKMGESDFYAHTQTHSECRIPARDQI